jgi:formamidopyrimidine-DNA glycosylase
MPELPEVETVRRGLEKTLVGCAITKVVLRRHELRRPLPRGFAGHLEGTRIRSIRRRAKYVVVDLDSELSLVMHLGMSGSFRIDNEAETGGNLRRHDHVIFQLSSGRRVIYNDPRRFGSMDIVLTERLDETPPFNRLGVEPLGPDLSAKGIAQLLAGKTTSIKAALLDQRIVAGLGNIYVCEALWRARISPLRKARFLVTKAGRPTAALGRLPASIRAVLEEAIVSGGSSLRNHIQTDGSMGAFQHSFDVYGRTGQKCHRSNCAGTIRRTTQTGRSSFYCETCQK